MKKRKKKEYIDNYYISGLIISYISYIASIILILTFFGWKLFLVFLLFALGLSGIIIWHILLPEIYKNTQWIHKLNKKIIKGK